jgi:hypothetical protein
MKNSILVLILGLSILSCENPSIRELGHGYFLTRNSSNGHAIGKPTKGYSTNEVVTLIIYGDIVSYDFDSQFIGAAEKPRDSIPGLNNLPYQESEKVFTQSSFKQYYILDKEKDQLYGPYKRETFDIKRKELKVSDNLTVDSNSR